MYIVFVHCVCAERVYCYSVCVRNSEVAIVLTFGFNSLRGLRVGLYPCEVEDASPSISKVVAVARELALTSWLRGEVCRLEALLGRASAGGSS